MSYWLEIHCDIGGSTVAGCKTFKADNPGIMVHKLSRVPYGLKLLKEECIKTGWTLTKGQWACRHCSRSKIK